MITLLLAFLACNPKPAEVEAPATTTEEAVQTETPVTPEVKTTEVSNKEVKPVETVVPAQELKAETKTQENTSETTETTQTNESTEVTND